MPVNEMFADNVITNLPDNPVESIKKLVDGYLHYVSESEFTPTTHFEQCIDGYALIAAYNNSYDFGLEMLQLDTDSKTDAISKLNQSIHTIREKLNYMYPAQRH